jgi:Zn-dependent alcohol dehydrogenase
MRSWCGSPRPGCAIPATTSPPAGNPMNVGVPLPGPELVLYQKHIQDAIFGMANPTYDIPRVLDPYRQGTLKLDELISRRYSLDEVAQGHVDMRAGINIRGVVTF